ncbi:MAG: DUF1631 domain-containing protein [Candidatus Thiodiazotropha sp.]
MSTLNSRRNKYQSQFQPLLNRCKDTVIVYLNALLTELFNNSDKALTGFAQKAETNEVQNRFFEAMAMIRNRHGLVEHEFRELISEGFEQFWKDDEGEHNPFADPDEDSELELVDHESMDVTTALENMISKTVGNHRSQLYALGQRLSVVKGGQSVKHKQIPAGPHHLTTAFSDAIDALGLETRIKLVVLALFDKYVLKQLGSIYEDFNNSLKDAGVLPHLRPTVQKSPDTGIGSKADERENDQPEMEQSQEELGEELFTNILDMMAHKRQVSPEKSRAKAAAAAAAGRPLGSAPLATPANLVSALNDIQPPRRADYIPDANAPGAIIPNIEIDEQFLVRVKHTLAEERHKLYDEVGADRLDAADEDTIDLVGMLFEYMLNDPVLPAVAKALISHLHTPYLKVAIIDRKLLTDSNHDARQLLDALVEAGSHWIDERNLKRGIYPDMQNVIDRVLKEFSDNVGLFSNLLATFKKRMDEFRRKSDILEKRAQDSLKGREKLNIARQRASQEMKARSFSEHLPKPVKEFLEQTWVDKLIFVLLRHPDGELSDDWKEALRISDEIAWAFEPKDESETKDLIGSLPNLRKSIEEGLASLGGFHQEKSKALFEILTSEGITKSVVEKAAVAESVPPQKGVEEKPKLVAVQTPTTPQDAVKEKQAKQEKAEEEIPEQEHAMMEKLRKIQFGTWFEVADSHGGEPRKVKLSWLSPLTASCMFVDRAGVQTAIKPLRTLAQEILSGESKILEDSSDPFVERTLHAIRRMLQRSLKTTEDIASEITNDDDERSTGK